MILSWQTEGDYEGLVVHIKNNSPQPERAEIIGLIGNKLISRNQVGRMIFRYFMYIYCSGRTYGWSLKP